MKKEVVRKTQNKTLQKLRLLGPYHRNPLVFTSNNAQHLSLSQHPPKGKGFR